MAGIHFFFFRALITVCCFQFLTFVCYFSFPDSISCFCFLLPVPRTVELQCNKPLYYERFLFAPVIVKYMEKILDIMKACYSEQIFPVPCPFLISRFHLHRTSIFALYLYFLHVFRFLL